MKYFFLLYILPFIFGAVVALIQVNFQETSNNGLATHNVCTATDLECETRCSQADSGDFNQISCNCPCVKYQKVQEPMSSRLIWLIVEYGVIADLLVLAMLNAFSSSKDESHYL